MKSKLMLSVVCMIGYAVSCIKADGHLSTPTNLTSKITRSECGRTKLCLDNPKGCDPSGSSQCFFTSVQMISSRSTFNLTVELSGNSTGYIALAAGVTSNLSQGFNTIFVCGNNNGKFFLWTATFSNNTLVATNTTNVNNIQGLIQPSMIQCVFSIPFYANTINFLNNVSATKVNISNIANSQLNVYLDILQGSTNGTLLGKPKSVFGSSVLVNLANVNSTKVATANSNAGISITSLLSRAAIFLLSIFFHLI